MRMIASLFAEVEKCINDEWAIFAQMHCIYILMHLFQAESKKFY